MKITKFEEKIEDITKINYVLEGENFEPQVIYFVKHINAPLLPGADNYITLPDGTKKEIPIADDFLKSAIDKLRLELDNGIAETNESILKKLKHII